MVRSRPWVIGLLPLLGAMRNVPSVRRHRGTPHVATPLRGDEERVGLWDSTIPLVATPLRGDEEPGDLDIAAIVESVLLPLLGAMRNLRLMRSCVCC